MILNNFEQKPPSPPTWYVHIIIFASFNTNVNDAILTSNIVPKELLEGHFCSTLILCVQIGGGWKGNITFEVEIAKRSGLSSMNSSSYNI